MQVAANRQRPHESYRLFNGKLIFNEFISASSWHSQRPLLLQFMISPQHTHRYGLCCHTVCRPVCVCVCVCVRVCVCVCVPSQSFPLLSAVSSWADQVHSGLSQHTDSKGQQWVYTWRRCAWCATQLAGKLKVHSTLRLCYASQVSLLAGETIQESCRGSVFSRDGAKFSSFTGVSSELIYCTFNKN